MVGGEWSPGVEAPQEEEEEVDNEEEEAGEGFGLVPAQPTLPKVQVEAATVGDCDQGLTRSYIQFTTTNRFTFSVL